MLFRSVHTLRLPNMLHGKIVRSPIAHGRIVRIDTSAARALPGVTRVLTAADVATVMANPHYGPAFHDQPVLAIEKVRHVGEPVALVLAADIHVAEEAARLVEVEYEELPAVFGEVGLSGEIRGVPQAALRIREARQMGFTRIVLPAVNVEPSPSHDEAAELVGVRHIGEALDALLG